MSPFHLSRTAIRALTLTAISVGLLSISLVWASRQQASSPSPKRADNYSSSALFADKGGIRPEAATITVNSLSDVANASDGLCTLREAIQAAHANTASGAVAGECAAGTAATDMITFSVTGTIDLASILPPVASAMNISGPGAALLTVRRSTAPGTPNFRIFTVFSGVTSTISGLTITNGRSADGVVPGSGSFGSPGAHGGGIMNSGFLTLTNMTITGNRTGDGSLPPAASFGTGSNFGGPEGPEEVSTAPVRLTMSNVTVSNNITGNGVSASFGGEGGRGGGIFIDSGTLTMTSCLLSGNVTGTGASSTSGGSGSGGEGGGIGIRVGTITMTNTSVINNTTGTSQVASASERGSGGGGAGIMIDSGAGETGAVTVINCTISGNHTGDGNGFAGQAGRGAGLNNVSSTNLTIIGSTISGNTTGNGLNGSESGVGAGLVNTNSAITRIINSTISGNSLGTSGFANGAGIWNSSQIFLTNSTVVLNAGTGLNGGGIQQFNNSSSATLRNSIVALNTGYDLAGGTYNSQGHNLIGNGDGATGFSSGIGDQVGTAASPLNPQLRPLANNGGLTPTHALLSNSTALDAGDNCVTDAAHCGDANLPQLTTDQRGAGFNRMVDGPDADTTATVDIGAYETQRTIANIGDTSTLEDTQVVVPFDGGDTSTITSVTATSDNASVVPNDPAHLSAAVTGSTVVITINPAANVSGAVNVTVTVNRTGGPESNSFLLTVNPVNDSPTFTNGPDQTINEDAGPQTINAWATNISTGAPDESGQTLTFQITGNTNASLFSAGPAIAANGTLTYTPAANANGSATITINLKDNGGTANGGTDTSASQTFTITVNAVNDVPSFTKGPDRTVNEDAGFLSSSWANSVSPGPNESNQTLTFQVTNNTNPSLFSTQPAISSSGSLSFQSATNANGSATITIVLKDNGGTANGGVDTSQPQTFTITVNPVNDAPSFTKGANQTVLNNAGAQTVTNWATNILAGPADESGQTVTFQITSNTRPGIFSVLPAINSNGTLTFTPNPNSGGTATITINLKDNGGTANGGLDTSATQSFNIVITPVGGFLFFTETNVNVNESQGSRTIFVLRNGDSSRPVTVDYATSGGTLPCSTVSGAATPKCDFNRGSGHIKFRLRGNIQDDHSSY
jgi:CSLREA domain-containing protein